MGISIFDETLADSNPVVFDDGNSPGVLTLTPNDKTLRRVDTILAVNNDTIDHEVSLRINIASAFYWLGSVVIPAGAGFAGTPSIDLLAACVPPTQLGLNLFSFNYLEVDCLVALSSGKGVWITAFGGLF